MARILVLVAVGMTSVVLTAARVHVFGHERRIWQDAVIHAPAKPRPWVNLGRQDHLVGSVASAEDAYTTAIVLAFQPGRSREERIVAVAVAEANLALLFAADRHLALIHRARAVDRLPGDPAITRISTWTGDITAR